MPAPAAKLFTSAVDVSGHFSSGSPPNLVRRLLAVVLPVFGLSDPAAAATGARLGRQLAVAGILVAFVLVARTLRRDADPWPPIATFFLAYLLLTPWVFYWHEAPLLGIVAAIPWSLTSLVAVALSITLVPLAPAGPPAVGTAARGSAAADLLDTLAAFAARYGGAVLVLCPRPPRPPPHPAAATGPSPTATPTPSRPSPARPRAEGGAGQAPGARAADGAQLAPVEHGLFQARRKCSKNCRVSSSRSPAGGVRPDGLDAVGQVLLPAGDHGLAAGRSPRTRCRWRSVVVAPLPRLTLAPHQAQLDQVADRAGDRGRAHPRGARPGRRRCSGRRRR